MYAVGNARFDERFNSLEVKMDEKFNTMDEKFNTTYEKISSLEKRINMQWALQIVTFLAILGLYLKGVVF